MNQILYNIDFLKVVFINAIVFHHLYNSATGIGNAGGLAVELFFIISGFLFCLTYKQQTTTYDFIVKKLIRFLPLLFFTDIILLFFTKFNLSMLFDDVFLLTQTGLTNHVLGYNHPAWFICILFWVLLLFFYLRKNVSENSANITLFIVMLLSLYMYVNHLDSFRVFRGMSAISIGYFCALIAKDIKQRFRTEKISKLFSILEISIFSFLTYSLFNKNILNLTQLMFIMGALCILFYLKKGVLSTWLNKPVFSQISKYVFPVFITHSLVYYKRLPIFTYINNMFQNPIAKYSVLICTSWFLAIILYYIIQKPCENILYKKLLNKN